MIFMVIIYVCSLLGIQGLNGMCYDELLPLELKPLPDVQGTQYRKGNNDRQVIYIVKFYF